MLDIGSTELLLVAIVALVVIGPKDLPKAMRVVGYWVGRARSIGRQFRSGFDAMVREAEMAEMEKKWSEENKRIMREHASEPVMTELPAPASNSSAVDDDARHRDASQESVAAAEPDPSSGAEGESTTTPVTAAEPEALGHRDEGTDPSATATGYAAVDRDANSADRKTNT